MKKYIGVELYIDSDDRFNSDVNLNIEGYIDEFGNGHTIQKSSNFSYETKLKCPFLFLPHDENGFVHLNCTIDEQNNIVYNNIKLFNILKYSECLTQTKIEESPESKYFGKKYDYYAIYFSSTPNENTEKNFFVDTIDFGNNILITNAWICFTLYYE